MENACLALTKTVKKNISDLEKIVGSYDAAYYLIWANNGHSLDKTPNGEVSKLYSLLLQIHKTGPNEFDEKSAILDKAYVYLPEFATKHGEWVGMMDEQGRFFEEPDISTIQPQYGQITAHESVIKFLNDPNVATNLLLMLKGLNTTNLLDCNDVIKDFIEKDRLAFILNGIAVFKQQNPNAEKIEILREQNRLRKLYNTSKLDKCINDIVTNLSNLWGLQTTVLNEQNIVTLPQDADDIVKFRVAILNSLMDRARDPKQSFAILGMIQHSITNMDITSAAKPIIKQYVDLFKTSNEIKSVLLILGYDVTNEASFKKGIVAITNLLCDRSEHFMSNKRKGTFRKALESLWNFFESTLRAIWWTITYVPNKLRGLDTTYHSTFYLNKTLNNVLDDILFHTALNTDLLNNAEILDNSLDTWIDRNVTDTHQVLLAIRKGLGSRAKSLTSVSNLSTGVKTEDDQSLLKITTLLSYIDTAINATKLNKSTKELEFYDAFLSQAIVDIKDALNYLINVNNSTEQVDPNRLFNIKTDIVGFYYNIFQNYLKPLQKITQIPELQEGERFANLIDNIILTDLNNVRQQFDIALDLYLRDYIDQFNDRTMTSIGNEKRAIAKSNAYKWLKNEINGGRLNILDLYVTPARASQSPIVRMVWMILEEKDLKVESSSIAIGNQLELIRTRTRSFGSRISIFNPLNKYAEKDANGDFTGNFISAINKGEFDRQYSEKSLKLCETYGIAIDESTSELVFPSDDIWKKYWDDMDDWLDGKVHRMYTSDYYKLRRRYLSRPTLEKIQNIQSRILKLYSMCMTEITYTKNGTDVTETIPVTAKLLDDSRNELELLLKLRRELESPYSVITDDEGNIVLIDEKTGDELKTAIELITWKNAKKDMNMSLQTPNKERYNAVLNLLNDEINSLQNKLNNLLPNDPEYIDVLKKIKYLKKRLAQFEYDNTINKINHELYENLESLNISFNKIIRLQYLEAKRQQIIELAKIGKGISLLNLDRLNDKTFAELKSIDEEISQILAQPNTVHSYKKDIGGNFKYNLLFGKGQVLKLDNTGNATSQTYFDWLQQQYYGQSQSFVDKYMYEDANGRKQQLSIFKYTAPKIDAATLVFGTSDTSVLFEKVPTGPFMDIDMDPQYRDNKYDMSSSEYMLIDKDVYKNDKFTTEIEDDPFYKKMLEIMEMAWENYAGINRGWKYKMPQRSVDADQMWGRRNFRPGHFWRSFGEQLVFAKNQTISFTERDTDVNESYILRPDGSIVESIPIRFTGKLSDPKTIDTDLVSSVVDFYKASLNYKESREKQALLELIKFELEGGYTRPIVSQQADVVGTQLSRGLYGRTTMGFGRGGRMTEFDKKYGRLSKVLRSATHSKLMRHNLRSVLKNAWDSFSNILTLGFTGTYFDFGVMLNALKRMGKDVFNQLISFNRSRTYSWTDAALRFNRVVSDTHELFSKQNQYWLRRFLNKSGTIEFEGIDYTFKAIITDSIYDSYRLIINPLTNKYEFANKIQIEYMFAESNGDREEGDKVWSNAKIKLADVYKIGKDGNFYLIPTVNVNNTDVNVLDIIRPIDEDGNRSYLFETKISSTIRQISGVVNGILNDSDKNALASNYVGALVVSFRGWMMSQGTEFNKTGSDFYEYIESNDMDGLKATVEKQLLDPNFEGLFNYATGMIESGLHRNLLKTLKNNFKFLPTLMLMSKHWYMKKGMTENEFRQLRNITASIFLFALTCAITTAMYSLHKDDPDDWLKSLLYATSIASISERSSQLGRAGFGASGTDLAKSVTVSTSYVEDTKHIMLLLEDLYLIVQDNEDEEYDTIDPEIISRGTFKNKTHFQRDLTKTLSLFNTDFLPIELALDAFNQTGALGENDIVFRDYDLNWLKSHSSASNTSAARFYSGIFPTPTVGLMLKWWPGVEIQGVKENSKNKKDKSGFKSLNFDKSGFKTQKFK